MVDVSSQNNSISINVSSSGNSASINATPDMAMFYSEKSREYATSDKLIDGKDYSSKYYANKSAISESNAKNYAQSSQNTYNQFQQSVEGALSNVDIAVQGAVESINTKSAEAIDNINSTKTTILNDIEFVADGEKKEIEDLADLIKENAEEIASRTSFAMFDTILKDHVLTYEESKGLALQGTYVYKTAVAGERYGYPDFYAKCLEEKDLGEVTEVTLGNYTITMYINANGHKFYDIADKEAIDAWFETYGTCWYYGIDTENERIYLPRNIWFEQLTADSSEVGSRKTAGLPNVTGSITGAHSGQGIFRTTSGAFTLSSGPTQWGAGGQSAENTSNNYRQANFDASKSNSIYGNSDTVQPNAVKKLLYICVGNTVSDTSWVDVVTQVKGGVKDLEDKTNEGIERLKQSSTALTQTQTTNCITEIPQRIKYTLEDGTLTIKAGTVVIVPYGTEDLTRQYPKGATFVHENFKVYDTQFADGKFFVWAEMQSDITNSATSTNTNTIINTIHLQDNTIYRSVNGESGTATVSSKTYTAYYKTDLNLIRYCTTTTTFEDLEEVISLPILLSVGDGNNYYGSISQVFNGMGYIGSTVWVDKGVKGLIPNGRNADGSLNNVEVETKSILTCKVNPQTTTLKLMLNENGAFVWWEQAVFVQENTPNFPTTISDYSAGYWYKQSENKLYYHAQNSTSGWVIYSNLPPIIVGVIQRQNVENSAITSFNPKLSFRAVDYNDIAGLKAYIVETYVNGTSWYRVYSDGWCEQGGRVSVTYDHSSTTITLLKKFKNTNYNIQLSHGGFANSGVLSPNWQSLTTSSFVLYADYTSDKVTAPTNWQACGYIA